MHTPLQVVSAPQPHTPATQAWPPWHALLQKPQLRESVIVFGQLCPHCVSPVAHIDVHLPCEHTEPDAHAMPQTPQFAPSDIRFTHPDVQAESPPVHWQLPPEQLSPMPHCLLHAPQFLLSVVGSMQTELHATCTPVHTGPPPALPPLFVARPPDPPAERPPEPPVGVKELPPVLFVLFDEVPQLAATNKSPAAPKMAKTERMAFAFA